MGHYDEQREKEAKNPICNHCKHDYTGHQLEIMCMDENGNCQKCRAELSGKFCTGQGRKDDSTKPKAVELLETSAATLIRCGKKYDGTGNNSERVMDRIVDMFNAATGHELSEAQGNIFMVCLKVVRSETSTYHDDDHYIDGVNYFAMAGEAASEAADD